MRPVHSLSVWNIWLPVQQTLVVNFSLFGLSKSVVGLLKFEELSRVGVGAALVVGMELNKTGLVLKLKSFESKL